MRQFYNLLEFKPTLYSNGSENTLLDEGVRFVNGFASDPVRVAPPQQKNGRHRYDAVRQVRPAALWTALTQGNYKESQATAIRSGIQAAQFTRLQNPLAGHDKRCRTH